MITESQNPQNPQDPQSPAEPSAAPASSTAVIQVEGVHKSFGDLHVLKDCDLTVRSGEVAVLVGPSGSGKSTLLRCIN
ncbi:MAG: ATP-binding cassette domain-containing protein, partial [Brachybacterium sp.]